MPEPRLTPQQRQEIVRRMRTPFYAFVALMVLLAINVALGATMPFHNVWILELLVLASMVVIVLAFSMEVVHEPPLVRLFAVLGFCWVAILFTMTMIDYLTR